MEWGTVGLVILGIVSGFLVPGFLFMAIVAIPGNSRPGDPMMAVPYFFLAVAVAAGAGCIAVVVLLAQHPYFYQILGGVALAIVTLVAVGQIRDRLSQRGTSQTATAAVPEPVTCSIGWNGNSVADFRAVDGLPLEIDPNTSGNFSDAQIARGSAVAGLLTFRLGATRNSEFIQWCRSAGSQTASNNTVGSPQMLNFSVDIFRAGQKIDTIDLRAPRPSQFHAITAPGGDGHTVDIAILVVQHQGWKQSWR